jgi:hypothetical protein
VNEDAVSQIVVATMTWGRTPEEEELLLGSLEVLTVHGLPILAADGGSRPEFVDCLRALPGVTVLTPDLGAGPRLLGQVRAALDGAVETGAEWILYTEPDKRGFFRDRVAALLEAPRENAGMLVPSRDASSFATFPEGQRMAERLLNHACGLVLGAEGDYLYGPMLMRRDLVPLFGRIEEPDLGFGWRTFMMAVSHRSGLPVRLWPADLRCPEDQRDEDTPKDRAYRRQQVAQGIRGLALGLHLPL